MVWLKLCNLSKNTTEAKLYHSPCVMSRGTSCALLLVMITLIVWLRWCQLCFTTVKLQFFSLQLIHINSYSILLVIIHIWRRYFETIHISSSALNFYSLVLASTDEFCLHQLLLWCSNGDILLPLFLPHLLIRIFL